MTITISNYAKTVEKVDWAKMPKTLKKVHDSLIPGASDNDWAAYQADEDIKNTIDIYLEKLNEYFTANPDALPKPAPKKAAGVKPAPRKKAAPKKAAGNKPKKEKVTKTSKAKSVEHIESDVRFIQRYVGMHGKNKTKDQLLSLLKGLQKAIVERRITKSSPHAEEIKAMEKSLKDCIEAMGHSILIEIAADRLARYQEIADSERVHPAIPLLKAYISLSGKEGVKDKAGQLHEKMVKALQAGKIPEDDKHFTPYMKALSKLSDVVTDRKKTVHINDYELNGLAGIGIKRHGRPPGKKKAQPVNGIDRYDILEVHLQAKRKTTSDAGLGSVIELPPTPAASDKGNVYSGAQIVNMRFDSIGLQGKLRELIGDPAPGFKAMIYGRPKQGKSTFAMIFAKELAKLGKVKYCALEEGFSLTLKDKLVRMGANVPNLYFSEDVGDVSSFRFVVIDSVSEGKFDADQLKALTRQYPKIAFIYVFHATKTGNFRGGQQFAHDVDVILRVDEGMVYAQGRFAPPAEMNIEEIRKAA